jgi:hypothetical protein
VANYEKELANLPESRPETVAINTFMDIFLKLDSRLEKPLTRWSIGQMPLTIFAQVPDRFTSINMDRKSEVA